MLGAGWYTLLGRAWMAGIGKTKVQLVAEHRQLAAALHRRARRRRSSSRTRSPGSCPKLGAAVGRRAARRRAPCSALALIGTTLAQNYGFEARTVSLWLINAGYMVVGMAIMGAIVGHWRKARRDATETDARPDRTPRALLHRRRARRAADDGTRQHRAAARDQGRSRPARRLAGPGVDGLRAHRPHEVAARDAARLVHAAREGAGRPRRRLPAATTTRSR